MTLTVVTVARAVRAAYNRIPMWVWAIATIAAGVFYVVCGLRSGSIMVTWSSVWMAAPWNWSVNVDIGWSSHGFWVMWNTL